jgi:hypothetical protein
MAERNSDLIHEPADRAGAPPAAPRRSVTSPGQALVDLLVITRGDLERDRRCAWALIDEVARELAANPAVLIPHTRDRAWLDNRRELRSFFVQELDRDGIVLFGEP